MTAGCEEASDAVAEGKAEFTTSVVAIGVVFSVVAVEETALLIEGAVAAAVAVVMDIRGVDTACCRCE